AAEVAQGPHRRRGGAQGRRLGVGRGQEAAVPGLELLQIGDTDFLLVGALAPGRRRQHEEGEGRQQRPLHGTTPGGRGTHHPCDTGECCPLATGSSSPRRQGWPVRPRKKNRNASPANSAADAQRTGPPAKTTEPLKTMNARKACSATPKRW